MGSPTVTTPVIEATPLAALDLPLNEGTAPAVADGRRRLDHLARVGPTAYAFTFRKAFPPAAAEPVVTPDDTAAVGAESYRSCG